MINWPEVGMYGLELVDKHAILIAIVCLAAIASYGSERFASKILEYKTAKVSNPLPVEDRTPGSDDPPH